ncbi:hypothetical protein FOZ61_008001 [Perkinsus olseni]|uniref:Uncharacterized protein n=1 Tax=Perkinsus olseni TaxID=32597 RepID=A0A7J6L6I1_PEROL|nr:hypothetical protein FOZ61_008001 [Perkinsus olseni]
MMIVSYPTPEDDHDITSSSQWIPTGGRSRHTPHPGGSYHAARVTSRYSDSESPERMSAKMRRGRVSARNVDEEQFNKAMMNAKRRELEMGRVLKSHHDLVDRLTRRKLPTRECRREMNNLLRSATEWQTALERVNIMYYEGRPHDDHNQALEDHRLHILDLDNRHTEAITIVAGNNVMMSNRNLRHELIVTLIREAKGRDLRLAKALARHRRGLEYLQREATLLLVRQENNNDSNNNKNQLNHYHHYERIHSLRKVNTTVEVESPDMNINDHVIGDERDENTENDEDDEVVTRGYVSLADLYRELGGHKDALQQVTNAVERMLRKRDKVNHSVQQYHAQGGNSINRVRQWQRALDEANHHVAEQLDNRRRGEDGYYVVSQGQDVKMQGNGERNEYHHHHEALAHTNAFHHNDNTAAAHKNDMIALEGTPSTTGDFHKYDEVLQQTARFGIINDNEKSEHRQQHGIQRQVPKGLDDEIFRETTTAAATVDDALDRNDEVLPKDYVSNLLLHNDDEPSTMIDKSKAADGQLQKNDIPTQLPAVAYRAPQHHKTKNTTLSHTVINAVDNGKVDDMSKRLPPQPSIERP